MAEPEEKPTLSSKAQGFVPPVSKNAIKRRLKRQRWEDSKEERKAYKKAKLKEKKEALKKSGQKLPRKSKPIVEGQEDSGIRVVIDCAFDELMTDKEIVSMSSQLTRCHADNRRSLKPFEIFLTSLDKRLGERMEAAMKGAHHRWPGVHVSTDPYEVVLGDDPLEHLVYLTADSPNVIQLLEKDKVYIIGGLVDRNRHKNICYDKAVRQGIQHGRLPIGDYIKMASRHVLTVNQVLEIMLRWLENQDWEKAFMHVIPKRKLPEAPESNRNDDDEVQGAEYQMDPNKEEITNPTEGDDVDD